jgi:TP901 family phage tail tape measure protein
MSNVVGSIMAKMMLNIDNFSSNLSKVQSSIEMTGKKLEGLDKFGAGLISVGGALTKGVTLPILAIGAAAVKTSSDFNASMSKVQAISGATGEQLASLKDKAIEMGAKTKFSASESAEAFQYMAMAGWKTEDMLQGISGIMNLAAADGLDLATTSDIVTDALTAFGLKASDSGRFADVLAAASSNANTNVSMLGESFKYVAPVAGALGFSVEDTSIALGLMANAGIKASQSGTSLRGAFTRMIKPTDKAAALMDKYHLSMTNSDGSMKSLSEVMGDLRSNLGNLTEAQQAEVAATIFGQEAMSGMLAIINASPEDYEKLSSAIYNSEGVATEMAETMQDNLKGSLEQTGGAIETLAIKIGDILEPKIRAIVDKVGEFVDKLNEMDSETLESIISFALMAAAIGPILLVIGNLIKIFVKVSEAVAAVKESFALFKIATGLATGPIILIVAAVVAFIAILVHLWKTNEEFRNKIIDSFNQMKETVTPIFEKIGSMLSDLWNNILVPFGSFMLDVFAPIFAAAIGIIMDLFTGLIQIIGGVIDFLTGVFTGNWQLAWDGIKQIFEGVWTMISGIFTGIWDAILGVLQVVWGVIGETITNAWNSVVEYLVGAWNNLTLMITEIFTNIGLFLQGSGESISNIFTTVWNAIYEFLSGVVSGILDFINEHFGAFFENISNIMTAVWTIITTIWDSIKVVVLGLVAVFLDLIAGNFEGAKETINNIMERLRENFDKIWNAIKTVVSNVVDGIRNYSEGVLSSMKDIILNILKAIATLFTNIFDAIWNFLKGVWEGIKKTFTDSLNSIKTWVDKTFNSLKDGIPNAMANMKTAVVNGFNNAIDWIKGLPKQALTWGKDMIDGFIDGVNKKLSALGDAAKGAANKIKSYLGFSVPEDGPLHDYESYMPHMIQGLTSTLKREMPTLMNVVKSITDNMSSMLQAQPDLAMAGIGSEIDAETGIFNRSINVEYNRKKKEYEEKNDKSDSDNKDTENNNKYVIEVPITLDGRTIAKATAEFTDEELLKIKKRKER